MRKIVFLMVFALMATVGTGLADTYSWLHSGDLGPTWDGYLVYLYSSSTTTLPGVMNPDLSTDSGFAQAGVQTTVYNSGPKTGYVYGSNFNVPADIAADDYALAIVFNTAGPIVAGSTEWAYFSTSGGSTPLQVSDGIPGQYTTSGSGNGWSTVVPEPGSLALFGLGLLTLAAGSRRFLRK
jgi:hypothetical protein